MHRVQFHPQISEEVVCRAKQGDHEAFEKIYRASSRRVYGLCMRLTRNPAEAEDLTQEAFLQVYRKIDTFRGESAFSTWLHRVTLNTVLMRLRHKTLPLTSIEAMETEVMAHPEETTQELGCEDKLLVHSVDRIALEAAIDALPPGYRITLCLHDIFGYEHNEVAEIMGCSVGNSKSQLHKARLSLRKQLLARQARETTFPSDRHLERAALSSTKQIGVAERGNRQHHQPADLSLMEAFQFS